MYCRPSYAVKGVLVRWRDYYETIDEWMKEAEIEKFSVKEYFKKIRMDVETLRLSRFFFRKGEGV
jgi:hypothetical protein